MRSKNITILSLILLVSWVINVPAASLLDNCTLRGDQLTCSVVETTEPLSGKRYYLLTPEKFSKMLEDIQNMGKSLEIKDNLLNLKDEKIRLLEDRIKIQDEIIAQYDKTLKSTSSGFLRAFLYFLLGCGLTIGVVFAINYGK